MAAQMADDEWGAQKQGMLPMLTELSVAIEETGVDVEEGCHGARNVAAVDWNLVELEERTIWSLHQ
jgi:hypothetical protein